MSTPLVALAGVAKRFSESDSTTRDVLSGVDLEVQAGDSIAIVGPSGSGKSTILNIIGGLLPQSSGSVLFEGTELSSLSPDDLAAYRNEEVGFVFQSHHLLPQCTALENVLIPTLVTGDKAERRAAAERGETLLKEVGLGAHLSHRPARMSGGECQRVAVVRSLINQPRLLLADEPTGSLDEQSADQLGELLCKLNRELGLALITVTHSPRLASKMGAVQELKGGTLSEASAQAR